MTARVSFDELAGGDVTGWAWSPAEHTDDFAAGDPCLEVICGNVLLGRRRRTLERADVNRVLNDFAGPKGFRLSAASLYVLSELFGNPAGLAPTIRFGDKTVEIGDVRPRFRDASAFLSLRCADPISPWAPSAFWFADSHLLKIRVEAGVAGRAALPLTVRFYQPAFDAAGGATLELVSETYRNAPELEIVAVPLRNPLLPLLLVAVDVEDQILFTDLLPFPSLCRDGLHAAELASAGPTGDPLQDLRALCDAYLFEAVGWRGAARTHSVGEIAVDLVKATGAEPIFSPLFGEWLGRGFKIRIGSDRADRRRERDLGDASFVDHIAAALAASAPSRPRPKAMRLDLPAAAYPTIAAITTRRLTLPTAQTSAPFPFIASETGLRRSDWYVRTPALGPWLDELQPAASDMAYPRLAAAAPGTGAEEPAAMALAICVRDAGPPADLSRIYPIAPDDAAPILRAGAASPARVSVLVSVRDDVHAFEALVLSLARQTLVEAIEIVAVNNRAPRHREGDIRRLLETHFPGRHQILAYDEPTNLSAQTNLAASKASHPLLLTANPNVVLHDVRTVATLAQMTAVAEVGSASCMLLKRAIGAAGTVTFRSAGYFPGRVDFLATPHVALAEPDCSDVLPLATYPVVANALDLAAIRAEVWSRVGGLDPARAPNAFNDVDLGVRLSEAGLANICTTAVSAYWGEQGGRGALLDVHAPAQVGSRRLIAAMQDATVLRRL